MVVTPSGISTKIIFVLPLKAFLPIIVTTYSVLVPYVIFGGI